MKKTILLSIFLLCSHFLSAQCPLQNNNGTQFDSSSLAVGNRVQVASMWGGEYMTINNVVAGHTYTFDNCNTPYDSEITIYAPSNSAVAFSTDGCGDDGQITGFVAPVSGSYKFQINGGSCSNATSFSQLYLTLTSNISTSTWTGTTNTDWATATNWSSNSVPTATSSPVIPNVTNSPIISSSTVAVANNITIDASATLTVNEGGSLTMDGNLTQNGTFNIKSDATTNGSLIVKGTATGNVTYLRFVTANADISKAWHLISSPVNGHNIAGFLPGMAKNGTKRGIAPYINTNGVNAKWAYYSEGDTPGAFTNGKGYTLKLDHALIPNGIALDFVGTLNTNNAGVAITVNATGDQYNAIGNPYTSYIDGGTFLSNNSIGILAEPTIWLWDSKANSNVGEYITKNFANAYKIAPGQGFFVKALATGTVNLLEAMQTHSGGGTFLKQENRPEIKLSIKEGTTIKSAEIFYIENKTTGFDDGYDSSLFTGVSNPFAIYTQLVLDNKGKNLAIQTLPNSNYENMVVPIGVNTAADVEITFSLNASNFTSDLKIFLEDRATNTFTRLDEANSAYKITPSTTLNGIGRFYIHTSRSTLTIEDIGLENVSVFKTDTSTLRITGLQNNSKTNVTLFNLLGKQVFNTSFKSNGVKDIALPKLATGVYVVKLKTDKGNLSKKIILE
ncbi:T9SS type A sorting domain-containing protein [Polaribacter sp. SA4-10]|uniref:T9SS type A sorting domain-containing protein n=1 Tax=Polaribacter sp. SA4-10 TaxID=754397 RepID=UPI000B3CFDF9|nr:T9SS type A sorting domain-containing protein [Polaribacter sp. SA4-10]